MPDHIEEAVRTLTEAMRERDAPVTQRELHRDVDRAMNNYATREELISVKVWLLGTALTIVLATVGLSAAVILGVLRLILPSGD